MYLAIIIYMDRFNSSFLPDSEYNIYMNMLRHNITVSVNDGKDYKSFVSAHHYSGTCPNAIYNFKFWSGDELIGVITYGLGSNGKMSNDWIELTRCAFNYGDHKHQPTSKYICYCDEWLFQNTKFTEIWSYYDETSQQNIHNGNLYEFSHYRRVGGTGANYNYVNTSVRNGFINKRVIWNKWKQSVGTLKMQKERGIENPISERAWAEQNGYTYNELKPLIKFVKMKGDQS